MSGRGHNPPISSAVCSKQSLDGQVANILARLGGGVWRYALHVILERLKSKRGGGACYIHSKFQAYPSVPNFSREIYDEIKILAAWLQSLRVYDTNVIMCVTMPNYLAAKESRNLKSRSSNFVGKV